MMDPVPCSLFRGGTWEGISDLNTLQRLTDKLAMASLVRIAISKDRWNGRPRRRKEDEPAVDGSDVPFKEVRHVASLESFAPRLRFDATG